MDTSKLKIKLGDHEFEAEGPSEIVQAQFSAFKDLVAHTPQRPAPDAQVDQHSQQNQPNNGPKNNALSLDKIMKTEGRVVSLTARASSPEDAIMLIILGQKTFRNSDGVTGGEIIDGLKVSGQPVDRIARLIEKLESEGHIIVIGVHRAKRYRLSNQGLNKAQDIAKTVLATVA